MNVRQAYIQGIDLGSATETVEGGGAGGGKGAGVVPNSQNPFNLTGNTYYCTRRYQVNLALGLLTQDKLLPVKFMASQLAIELTLEQPSSCMVVQNNGASGITPSYAVGNINLIPEILEFDASYDAMFLKGLQDGGVPIKFSSWHTFIFSTGAAANVNLLVQERSRSVKALFAVQRRNPSSIFTDAHATLFDSSTYSATGNTMQNYQWRIGGRYFPAQPVQLSTNIGTSINNGGAEAFVELQKALNIVGDYRLSSSVNTLRWALPPSVTVVVPQSGGSGFSTTLSELDYQTTVTNWSAVATTATPTASFGSPQLVQVTIANTNSDSGTLGSCCYASAIDLETSNGIEISGLNAEEQSDIAFIANWASAQASGFNLEVYSFYDAMIILRENNVLELIQ